MTVYSKPVGSQVKVNSASLSPISIMNIGLLVLGLATVLVFVFYSNYVVSERYSLNILQQQLSKVNSTLNLANADIENSHSLESLLIYAKSAGMTEAKDTQSIFENSSVALGVSNQN